MTEHRSLGHIVFDATAPQEYIDLVKETLEGSASISTKWTQMDGHPEDVLVVREVTSEDEVDEPPYAEVTFHPQIWYNEYAKTSDETITYRVPVADATDEEGELFRDDSGESDQLKHHRNAPPEVIHYPGPFYITLEVVHE